MIDSSSKIPTGLLEGNLKDLGVYDECVAVQVQKEDELIRGRHCMYSFLVKVSTKNISLSPTFSICIPDGCNANDLSDLIQQRIHLIPNSINISVEVESVTCSAVDPEPWNVGGIMTLCVPNRQY